MRKNLMLVSNTAWSILNFRASLIRFLQSKDFSVVVVCPNDSCSFELERLGCTVVNLSLNPKGLNPFSDISLFFHLIKAYVLYRPVCVFHYTIKPNIYGSLAAALLSIPAVSVTTGLGYVFTGNKKILSSFLIFLYRFAFLRNVENWFLNPTDRNFFLKKKIASKDNAKILPGEGIDCMKFTPKFPSRAKKKFSFLYVGRLLFDKGLGELVEAARLLRDDGLDFSISVIGDFYEGNPSCIPRNHFQAWLDEGLINYLGYTNDVRPLITEADCVVLPSYREGLPRTLLEASAMAKPVIATKVPGCEDVIIDAVTGYLVPVRDSQALAGAMKQMCYLDATSRAAMGLSGRQYVLDHFDDKHVLCEYARVLGISYP